MNRLRGNWKLVEKISNQQREALRLALHSIDIDLRPNRAFPATYDFLPYIIHDTGGAAHICGEVTIDSKMNSHHKVFTYSELIEEIKNYGQESNRSLDNR